MAVGETIADGSVVWKKDFIMSLSKLPLAVGYNHKETFTSSGSFTAPITGLYKITLQGGGGGGNAKSTGTDIGGFGGGSGAKIVTFEPLMAGQHYNFVIGAGGEGYVPNRTQPQGGTTSITLNNNVYEAGGGQAQFAGNGTKNGEIISRGLPGNIGTTLINGFALSGTGGGEGAGSFTFSSTKMYSGWHGSGGAGASYFNGQWTTPGDGGDGYITFEWFDPADVWPELFPVQN